MNKPDIIILMGSKADLEFAQKVADAAIQFGLTPVLHVASAHKTALHLIKILDDYESDPSAKVYITIAGRSNALSGFVDGYVKTPVIACPPASTAYGGADIYSSLRMPSGIAPAVVLEPENAALLAAKILSHVNKNCLQKVQAYKAAQMQKIIEADAEVNGK
jgi:5-(carboxyamino)imidazole ribonucleotide mutase/phosphoribosylaminoimidazole-succinocarboxamide synthase